MNVFIFLIEAAIVSVIFLFHTISRVHGTTTFYDCTTKLSIDILSSLVLTRVDNPAKDQLRSTTTALLPYRYGYTIFQKRKFETKSINASKYTKGFINVLRGGSIFSGWNPFGYGLTDLGAQFLLFEGSLDCDVGRFLATFKSGRKRQKAVKDQWLEIVRVSKTGQSMRIYRMLDELLKFCVTAGFLS